MRITSVARTVVDLARTSSFRSGVVVADSALRGQQTTKDELRSVLAACARWPGIRQARLVVEFSDGLAESALESISRSPSAITDFPRPSSRPGWEATRRGRTSRFPVAALRNGR
jgi:hypothetical protein